ncbi:MAG: ATP-binding protein [Thermoplasmata archaeon]|nr:ATP-binding protein [Thermoplasmata archaeon]
MDKQEILTEMYRQNPWWESGNIQMGSNIVERDISARLLSGLGERKEIQAVLGLRRAGKTTLLRSIIRYLLEEERIDSRNILYFSFDLATTGSKEINPGTIIQYYEEMIVRRPLQKLEKRVFIFFDEIQMVSSWGAYLKSVHDREYDLRMVVSGSSSMNITKGAGESLVGRIMIYRLDPFSFREYLGYKRIKIEDDFQLSTSDITLPLNQIEIKIAFEEYFERGGLPEPLLSNTYPLEQLKQNLDLTFFRDIVEMFPIKRVDVLQGIFRSVAINTGQRINWANLSNDLDSQYRTVREYAQYLQDSYLIEKSTPQIGSHSSRTRKMPKMYVADHSFNRIYGTKRGLKAETIAFNHLKRLTGEIGHMTDPEIDITFADLAFEIKYVNRPEHSDVRGLLRAPENKKLFLITENTYDTWTISGRKIHLMPLWLLCLCGP